MAAVALAVALALAACGQVTPADPTATVAPDLQPLVVVSPSASLPLAGGPPASPATAQLRVTRAGIRLPAPRSRAVAITFGSTILVCGGLTSAGTTGTILRIDLRSGRVTRAGTLAAPVHDAGGAVLGAVGIIVGGGKSGPASVVQQVAATGGSVPVGHLPGVRADLVAVAVDGELVVVGGGTPAHPDDAVLATRDGRHFASVARLRTAVRYPAVAVLGGLVYVIGGSTPAGDSRIIQAVDPRTGVARIVGHLAHGLSHASAVVVGGSILIAGGRTAGRAQNGLLQFDPGSGKVTSVGSLPYAVSDMAAVVVDGTAYLIGGEALGPVASIITIAYR